MNNQLPPSRYKSWIMASRPKTLSATVGPIILGAALAYHHEKQINVLVLFLTLVSALLLQIGTNFVNDYYDFIKGTDDLDRLGPTRVTQAGLIAPKDVKKGFIIAFALAAIIGSYLMSIGGIPIILIGIFSLFFAYAYTGGPFPLSYFGLGEVFALIFFGPIPVWGTYYLLTGDQGHLPALAGLGPGLIAATLMSINNLRDIKSDTAAKKFTLAVLLGERFSRAMTLGFVMLAGLLPFILSKLFNSPWIIIATPSSLLFYKSWKYIARGEITSELNNCLASTGKYLLIYSLLLSVGLLL